MEKLVVVGAGGLGKEVICLIINDYNSLGEFDVLGFIDKDCSLIGSIINGFPVLGDDTWLLQSKEEINVVIAIGSGKIRKNVYESLSTNKMLKYPSIFAKNTVLLEPVKFGQGCITLPSCVFSPDVSIGDFTIINPGCTIAHDTRINRFVTVSPGVNIAGNVSIEEHTSIGIGACVIQGIRIGINTIIGAGATVIDDIPDNCTAVGVPAKPIKFNSI